MLLAKAIAQIASDQERFSTSVEAYKSIGAEAVAELQRQIDVKNAEFEELCESTEHEIKRRKIDLQLQLTEHKRAAAVELLAETDEVPILKSVYDSLQAELATTRTQLATLTEQSAASLEKAVADAVGRAKAEGHAALSAAVKAAQLEHKAAVAELVAQSSQAAKEVAALRAQINDQRDEIKEQRKVTISVAESCKQGAIQQTIGGKM